MESLPFIRFKERLYPSQNLNQPIAGAISSNYIRLEFISITNRIIKELKNISQFTICIN